jgi:hypothetical protein
MGRRNAALAITLLALGLTGVALTGVATGSNQAGASEIKVTVRDGKVVVSPTTFPAGKVTLVVVNRGTKKHALAIMGTTMSPKRTSAIAVGKTARLTVTLAAGKYHVWDPVTSSMSHARYLTVKAPKSGTTGSGGSAGTGTGTGTGTGSGTGSSTGTETGSGSGSSGGGTGSGAMDPGMEGCDH